MYVLILNKLWGGGGQCTLLGGCGLLLSCTHFVHLGVHNCGALYRVTLVRLHCLDM